MTIAPPSMINLAYCPSASHMSKSIAVVASIVEAVTQDADIRLASGLRKLLIRIAVSVTTKTSSVAAPADNPARIPDPFVTSSSVNCGGPLPDAPNAAITRTATPTNHEASKATNAPDTATSADVATKARNLKGMMAYLSGRS